MADVDSETRSGFYTAQYIAAGLPAAVAINILIECSPAAGLCYLLASKSDFPARQRRSGCLGRAACRAIKVSLRRWMMNCGKRQIEWPGLWRLCWPSPGGFWRNSRRTDIC